jgi:hypothetical protein
MTRLKNLIHGPISPALFFSGTLVVEGRPLEEALDTLERLHNEVNALWSPAHQGVPAKLVMWEGMPPLILVGN